jgi:hypothetical protein
MTHLHPLLICAPAVPALIVRRSRRGESVASELARIIRDMLTLRMVLHASEPGERPRLITAHSTWRSGSRIRSKGTASCRTASRRATGEPTTASGPEPDTPQ